MSARRNTKGRTFELRTADALETLRLKHPKRVRIVQQPRLALADGGEVVPDFDLQFDLLFEEGRYLIECQDRTRSNAQIAHKIRHMKALSSRNRFIFVYASTIPQATRHILEADGVLIMSFEEFVSFLARLELQLRLQEAEVLDVQGVRAPTARLEGKAESLWEILEAEGRFDNSFTPFYRKGRGPGNTGSAPCS